MRVFLLLPTLLTLTACEVLPNIGYLLRGYHLYKGNPLATQVTSDPGFVNLIFEPSYSQDRVSGDKKYDIPDGTRVYPKDGCTQAFNSELVQSPEQYQRLLKDMVKTNYTGFEHVFKGSVDYRDLAGKHQGDISIQHLITQVVCVKYEAVLDSTGPPPYNPLFVDAVKTIYGDYQRDPDNTEATDRALHNFLNTYGTHFMRKVELGSRISFLNTLDSNDRYELEEAGLDMGTGAVLSLTRKMGHVLSADELAHSHLFDRAVSGIRSSSSSSYTAQGALDVLNSTPIPLYYEVERIDALFVKSLMKTAGVNYKFFKGILTSYFSKYCENENKYSGEERCAENPDAASASSLSARNFRVVFPESGEGTSTNHVLVRSKLPELEGVTISWWMKTEPYMEVTEARRHILSYSCDGNAHLRILAATEAEGGCLRVELDGEDLQGSCNCYLPFDNNYHHYTVVWSSQHGRWQVYIDGNVIGGGSDRRGYIIPAGGYLVLGQQHESGNVIDDPLTAFRGELAYLNIWNYAVNGVEARRLSDESARVQGNVVAWDQTGLKFSGEGLDVRAIAGDEHLVRA